MPEEPRLGARRPRLPYGSKARYLKAYTRGWDEEKVAEFTAGLRHFAAGEPNSKGEPIKLATAADLLIRIGGPMRHATIQAALKNDPAWRSSLIDPPPTTSLASNSPPAVGSTTRFRCRGRNGAGSTSPTR
jgi:hypothetical protein